MTFKEKALLLAGGTYPIVVMVAALLRWVSYDLAIALILLSFAPALFPMIANNRRNRSAQSAVSTVTTTNGEFAIGVIFFVMALMISFWISIFLGAAWAILAAQSFLYGRKPSPLDNRAVVACAKCDTPMYYAPGIGPYCPNMECDNADGPCEIRGPIR